VTRSFAIAGEAGSIPDLTAATPGQLQLTLQELLPERPGAVLMIIATLPEGKRTLPEIRLLEKAARERIGGN
jgi:non-ribosomal peptide synthetase component F